MQLATIKLPFYKSSLLLSTHEDIVTVKLSLKKKQLARVKLPESSQSYVFLIWETFNAAQDLLLWESNKSVNRYIAFF